MKSPHTFLLAPLFLLLLQSKWCDAFPTPVTGRRSSSGLKAWSLEIPENLGSFKSTWYNTVENPTARRTIYDEWVKVMTFTSLFGMTHWSTNQFLPRSLSLTPKPHSTPDEFHFVTAGSDWPSAGEEETIRLDMEKQRVQINPIRRAAQWVLRRGRNSSSWCPFARFTFMFSLYHHCILL